MNRRMYGPLLGATATTVALLTATAYAWNPNFGWEVPYSKGNYSAYCSTSPIQPPANQTPVTCQVATRGKAANSVNYQFTSTIAGPYESTTGISGNAWFYLGEECPDGNYYYTDWCSNTNANYQFPHNVNGCQPGNGGNWYLTMACNGMGNGNVLNGYGETWATNQNSPPWIYDF